MSERRNAKLLKVLGRQPRQDGVVYFVLAECRLILPGAQAPSQTTMSVTAPTQGCCTSSCGLERVSRRSRSGSIDRSVSIGAIIRAVGANQCQEHRPLKQQRFAELEHMPDY